MSQLSLLLAQQHVVIIDGALGTELERRGVTINNSKLWSAQLLIQDPSVLQAIHYDYCRAGADITTTASYQASVQGFLEAGISPTDADQVFVKSVELCDQARNKFWEEHCSMVAQQEEQQACSTARESDNTAAVPARHRPLIAYSCGAYGAAMADGSEYSGKYADSMSVEQLMAFHQSRLEPIRGNPAVDILAFETIPCLKEAEAITRVLHTGGFGVPAWVSFSCRDGKSTHHGESFAEQCIPLLCGCPAVAAIGVNCIDPAVAVPLLLSGKEALDQQAGLHRGSGGGDARSQPVLACYPNSGEPWDSEHRCYVNTPDGLAAPANFAAEAGRWVEAGARLVGGCCRTTPHHIAELRRALLH